MAEGFLGRWSQRKQAVREGRPTKEPPAPPVPSSAAAHGVGEAAQVVAAPAATSEPLPGDEGAPAAPPPPPPTMEDVAALTPASDFSRFMRADVEPDVKNEAMKKLFADPHFNVMDRMDIYIDDYNTPDPLPPSLLRKMTSAHFLGLFDEEKKPADGEAPPRQAATPSSSDEAPDQPALPTTETEHHDNPDLRLQQDHAAGPQESGGGSQ